jgi:hypothetical protein
MTIAAAFALGALTGPMVMAIVALALLWGRPLANDQDSESFVAIATKVCPRMSG